MLQALIDVAHDRHAPEHQLARADQRAAQQVGCERADELEADDGEQQAHTRHGEVEVVLGIVDPGNVGLHPRVDDVDEVPGDVERDRDGAHHHQPGQEIVAQARAGVQRLGRRVECQLGEPRLQLGRFILRELGKLGLEIMAIFMSVARARRA